MSVFKDTIFALATPFGKSGVAVIRLSGGRARATLAALTNHINWTPNMARYARFHTSDGAPIDNGLALFFQAPKSFTGEDVVELHIHGSLGVIRELLDMLGKMDGLRHAEPGEFTRRAFLNGKMDLLEAEGLADLIDAETQAQKIQALEQMQGTASRYYEDLRTQTVTALALLEAYIDFPDEEIPESVLSRVQTTVDGLKATLCTTLADNRRGEMLREGIRVVILGAPNVGKSSLLNALAKKDAAIVSHHAGTTRDAIDVHLVIGGFPVILTDTAGLRDASDEIEKEGVRRALKHAGTADITLVMLDATQLLTLDTKTLEQVTDKSIIIVNKCDLAPKVRDHKLSFNNNILYISVETGQGIVEIIPMLEKMISTLFNSSLSSVITRARHRDLLQQSLHVIAQFSTDKPLELACEELRQAAHSIGRITGKITVDDVLDVVFKQFCIGK
jgi:tRNA modification GTPase